MKLIIATALCLLSLNLFGADSLSDMKTKATSSADQQMTALKEARACVITATSQAMLKACRYVTPEGRIDVKEATMEPTNDTYMKTKKY
ncbi:MAG: hypothetical protein H7281_01035 [Bacteriovorax sp.]|nr:hypothetical protein [Bacteriovorax sp.]